MAQRLRSGMGAGHKSQHAENRNHGGGAIADEGQGQADNRHNTDAHTDIDDDLEHQRGSCTEAHQTADVILAPHTHPDTPGDDGKFQDHDQNTAEEAQLFTDGGEDVVRMLGEQVTALGPVAVEQALARQTAAGKGLEVDLVVVAGADALGIKGGVDQDHDTFPLVITHDLPEDGEGSGDHADGQSKPAQVNTAGKSHTDENEHENQGNTGIIGNGHIQAHQDAKMENHLDNGGEFGDVVLVGCHDGGHDDNVGDLTDLRRLNIEGQNGEVQPASVAGAGIRAEGNQQEQQEHIECHQEEAVLRHQFHVQGRHHSINTGAQEDGQQLDNDVF